MDRYDISFLSNNRESLYAFLNSLIEHQLFKILPMKESESESLCDYLDSLNNELHGAKHTFPCLNDSPEYIRILNTMGYLLNEEYSVSQCKREVFKMISLTKKIYSNFYIDGE